MLLTVFFLLQLRILSLKCLVKLFRKSLPSLNENINDISDSIFTILGEYSSPAMTGDNAELLMSAAKVNILCFSQNFLTVKDIFRWNNPVIPKILTV